MSVMKRKFKLYNRPSLEMYEVAVELGYRESLDGEASELDGSKDEGEW